MWKDILILGDDGFNFIIDGKEYTIRKRDSKTYVSSEEHVTYESEIVMSDGEFHVVEFHSTHFYSYVKYDPLQQKAMAKRFEHLKHIYPR